MAIKPTDAPAAPPPKPETKAPVLRPKNPDGNPGYHPSTKDFEHDGNQHDSGMR